MRARRESWPRGCVLFWSSGVPQDERKRADVLPEGLQPQEGGGAGARPELPLARRGPAEGAGLRGPRGRGAGEARPRVRLLLRRRPRGRVRLRGAGEASRTGGSSSPARSSTTPRSTAGSRRSGSASSPTTGAPRSATPGSRRADVVILPAFGVHGGGAAAPADEGLRPRGHDLRQRAERLEERPPLRPRRLHLGHPRQALPRGDEGHRLAGPDPPGRALPLREGPPGGRSSSATSSAGWVPAAALLERFPRGHEPRLRPRARPARRSASPTRRPC